MRSITHPAGNWLLAILFIVFPLHIAAGRIIYVDSNAIGDNNGSSWTNAYYFPQNALAAAVSGDSIWVATDTYKPDRDYAHPSGTGNRNATFQLKNGVALYGGFPSGGGPWSSRNPDIYSTNLSGDINIPDNNSDNSYHVVTSSGTNSTAILDGFTITQGKANPYAGGGMANTNGNPTITNCKFTGNWANDGSGMYNYGSSPTVTNCTFSGNSATDYGGGMFNSNGSSPILTNCTFINNSSIDGGGMVNVSTSPIITNCSFIGNSATYGGGIYNDTGSPTLTNCIFISNSAVAGGGMVSSAGSPIITNCSFIGNTATVYAGAMENVSDCNPMVTNCIFSGNSAGAAGGGMTNMSNSNAIITNCTFSGNSSNFGGGIYDYNSSPTLANCILWDNTAGTGAQIYNEEISFPVVSFSDVQGGWTGTGNIDANPSFVDADGPDNIVGTADDNLRLLSGSPCIDDGNNIAVPGGIVNDLDGLSRFRNDASTSDTGYGTPPIVDMGAYEYQIIVYVNAIATGANDGSNWTNAYKFLQDAINGTSGSGAEIWVAQGTYRPDEDTNNPSGSGDRNATFWLENRTVIYGGFPSGGGTWANRDPNLYETILSGDLAENDIYVPDTCNLLTEPTRAENSYHVVTGSYFDENKNILDGFTIRAGNADLNEWPKNHGGGMFNSANSIFNNCKFTENSALFYGGAVFSSSGEVSMDNCTFYRNAAEKGAGGMEFYNSSNPILTNCSFISNKSYGYRGLAGGLFNAHSNTEVSNCIFSNNSATFGGAVGNVINCSPTITNCIFNGNTAEAGGAVCDANFTNTIMANCTFSGNSTTAVGGAVDVQYDSFVSLSDCNFSGNSAGLFGGGIVLLDNGIATLTNCILGGNTSPKGDGISTGEDSTLYLSVNGINLISDEFYIGDSSQIMGGGRVVIELGGQMIIDSNAVVDLNNLDEPNLTGTIICDGLLKVTGNGQLRNADVNVSREAGGYFGKFEADGNAQATNLDIYSDGDRFMDVNSSTFTGTIANNRIYVTITEGQNGSTEGILEVCGLELPSHPCDFNNPNVKVCQLDSGTMPVFDTNYWTLERLDIAAGAKVTLMNRFSSGNGNPEVLYAKDLVLGAGCVLNVGTEHLFYTNLTGDSNSINRVAQLGFSLDEIDCDSNAEFQSRVGNNNYIDPVDPCLNRIQVERVTGLDLDPNGVMKMTNLEDPCSGDIIYARAKARFASCSEDKIRILFNYLFDTSDPCAQIVVYLSDVAELLEPNDPCREVHYKEVSRILNPPYSRPGSAGSGRFGDFDKYVSTDGLNLSQGTWVELELIQPAPGGGYEKSMGYDYSEQGYIDNWDTKVSCYSCSVCLDLDSSCHVEPADFLMVVSGTGSANTPTCVDGGFSTDGYTDPYDTPSWDWTLNDKDNDQYERDDRCGEVPLSGGGGFPASCSNNPLSLTGLNNLLISGKRADDDNDIKMKDRLYVFDSSYDYKQSIGLEPNDRCNIRTVRGQNSVLYQINSEKGVLRLDTGAQIVPPGQIPYYINEPRYNQQAAVYAGIGGTDSAPYGRPILDAAFDANFVYVVPVVVVPIDNVPYAAAAKLQLTPSYQVVKLYDETPLPNDNQSEYRNSLREIELDSAGNVYVTNANKMNASDILWKYEPNGLIRRLELYPADPCSPRVRAPAGMCVSSATNMLYIASSLRNEQAPNSTVIQGFSTTTLAPCRTITVSGMHHVTSITEDPVTKTLWVAGFNLNSNSATSTFYEPYLAKVPIDIDINEVNALCMSEAADLAMPLSICWTGALQAPPELCGGADLDGNGKVNLKDMAILAKHWLNGNCGAPNNPCEGADLQPQATPDGDVDMLDLDILANYWLNINCQ